MDVKDFIKETVSGIVDATKELQLAYEGTGVIINPPVSNTERDLFEENGPGHTYRRVEIVEFDLAVTTGTEKGGGGKVGLKILSAEAGLDGKATNRNEEVSRVRFSVPISLSPSAAEAANKEALEQRKQQISAANRAKKASRRW